MTLGVHRTDPGGAHDLVDRDHPARHRHAAAAGVRAVPEAFADRGYAPDGMLVSRREPGAVLTEPDAIAARVVRMVTERTVTAVDGSVLPVRAESVCVHGDSPGAVEMARAVRSALDDVGAVLRPFC